MEVYRLLRRADVSDALLEQEVHILWPDNGVWYGAVIKDVRNLLCPPFSSGTYVHAASYVPTGPQHR